MRRPCQVEEEADVEVVVAVAVVMELVMGLTIGTFQLEMGSMKTLAKELANRKRAMPCWQATD